MKSIIAGSLVALTVLATVTPASAIAVRVGPRGVGVGLGPRVVGPRVVRPRLRAPVVVAPRVVRPFRARPFRGPRVIVR